MTALILFVLFIASSLLAFFLGPCVVRLAHKMQLLDSVNARSAHTTATPRGGGVIFIIVMCLAALLLCAWPGYHWPKQLPLVLLLAMVNALVGLLDDKLSLSFWKRLLLQFALVAYPSMQMPLLFAHIPAPIQYALYIVAWVWFINLFNFMDGTDGYATQESLFILLFIVVVNPSLRAFSLCLMGACLGFLRINYPKAKIFMGDVGSYFLGYLLFALMLMSIGSDASLLVPCMIISLLFSLDASYTLLKRLVCGECFWRAHRSHWYQRLYNLGYTHRFIFWLGVCMNVLLLALALQGYVYSSMLIDLLLAVVMLSMVALFIKFKTVSQDAKHSLLN
jgi:Fuc2NAc and GlcNAc transferase